MSERAVASLDEAARDLRTRFADLPPPIELALDQRRPTELGTERHRYAVTLSPATAERVVSAGAAPGDVFMAALAVYVLRSTGQTSFLLGRHDGDQDAAALLDLAVEAGATFEQLMRSVEGAGADGPVDLPDLARTLGLDGRRDRNPVASIMGGPAGSDGPPLPRLPHPDLELRWEPATGAPIGIAVLGAADLFAASRVERIARQYIGLLEALLAEPEAPVDTVPFLPEADLDLLSSWQGPIRATSDPHLGQRLSAAAGHVPDQVAVEHDDRSWTYAELESWTNRLAAHLRRLGIRPDDVVAIQMDRSIELVGSIIAVLKAGGAYLPVDPAYPAVRQTYMLQDSAASVVLTRTDTAAPESATDATIIEVDAADAAFLEEPDEALEAVGDGSHLAYVIYTSGSTGQPKAVALPRRALANLMDWQLARDGFAEGRRTLQFSSPSFDVSFQEICSTLLSGGTLVLIDELVRRDPRGLLDHVRRHQVERIFLPNVALRGLADVATSGGDVPTSLREVYTAGEQLRVDGVMRSLFTSLPECRLENQYGPSESHVVTAYTLPEDPSTWPVLPPIGAPIANSVVEVLDAAGNRVPIGVPGELWLGGACLARGYLNKPEATAERFRPDPFRSDPSSSDHPSSDPSSDSSSDQVLYRTGDQVRWTEAGVLDFLGRLDDQVKYRGFRIEPSEIAAVIADADGVHQAAVAVRQADSGPTRLVAYVELADPSVTLADIRRFAAERLPDYMVPTSVMALPSLPLTASGKVDTSSLPEPEFDRSALDSPFVLPRTATEVAIGQMWEALLELSPVGAEDDFFDLGGDSLMAVEMFAMIYERFEVELPLGALAQAPTVAGLANAVDAAREGGSGFEMLVPIRTSGERRPLFCVHGGSGNVASFPRLARALHPEQPFYGVQWPGLAEDSPERDMEGLAARYIEEIKTVQPEGPYRLAGQCIGGLIVQEMSRQLVEAGEKVELVVMYDSPMLWSPAYSVSGRLPRIPGWLRPVANRGLSMAVAWMRFLKGSLLRREMPPAQAIRIRVRQVLRRQVEWEDLFWHAAWSLCAIAWRHRPPQVDVPTLLIHSGEKNAGNLALTGTWDDDMLGWRHRVGPYFEGLYASGGHNDLMYSPDAVAILTERLDTADRAT